VRTDLPGIYEVAPLYKAWSLPPTAIVVAVPAVEQSTGLFRSEPPPLRSSRFSCSLQHRGTGDGILMYSSPR